MSTQTLPDHVETLIIGAGLAGLSTALHLGPAHNLLVVEANDYVGGKARTERIGDFLFDVTGHWLHLRDPGIRVCRKWNCGGSTLVAVLQRERRSGRCGMRGCSGFWMRRRVR